MTYAMICNNRIIEIVHNRDVAPVWPPDANGNPVTAVECPEEATRSWLYNAETGEVFEPVFVEPEEPIEPEEPVTPEPTQLDRIEAKIQINEDLQAFYDEIVEEVGL